MSAGTVEAVMGEADSRAAAISAAALLGAAALHAAWALRRP